MIEAAKNKRVINTCIIIAVLIVLAVFPLLFTSNYILTLGINFCIFAAMGLAWNIVGGYAEQISWCHASFVAIGAYSSYLLYNLYGITPWIGIMVGVCISIVAATVIGLVSFRLRGPFFSLCTIAFGEIVRVLLLYRKDLTKGANGLVVTFKQDSLLNLTFTNYAPYYYILLILLVLVVIVSWGVKRSKMGYYLNAIKADEDAAQSLGIDTYSIKLVAFIVSAALTTMVGGVFAFFMNYIDPASFAGLHLSIKIGTMAILGGLGTLSGPLIGAIILVPLSEVSNMMLGSSGSGMLLYGLLMIIIILFRPGGVRSFFIKDDAGITDIRIKFSMVKGGGKRGKHT